MTQATKNKIKEDVISYVFLIPVLIGIAVFAVYPLFMALIYSFSDFNGAFATKFGFFNYANIFNTSDTGLFQDVLKSFGVTFEYAILSMAVGMILGYALALFLRKNIPGARVIRLLCYLPCLIPGFIGGFIYRDIFAYSTMDAGNGIINTWLTNMGLSKFPFFESPNTSMFSLILTGLWGLGGSMILLLAAFENINPELYEASDIDGAGYFTKLIRITIPLTTPILFYNLVVSMIGSLQIFATYGAYGTGAEESLFFIAIRIYRTAFLNYKYGLACAMSYLLFIVIAAISLVMFKLNGWVHYGDE